MLSYRQIFGSLGQIAVIHETAHNASSHRMIY